MRYLDVCSGYSAITLATQDLGWECAGYAEIDAFPSAVLGARYSASRPRYMPDPGEPGLPAKERKERERMAKAIATLSPAHFGNRVTNFGDFTQIREDDVGPIDLLAGGTPCQAFSIAGNRLGLDDPRGNLTLEFLALARRLRPRWLEWENVAGVLSHDRGRTLGTFLRLLGELGYGWAYRVLDVQYIRVDGFPRALPQRRRRVFVVGCLGNPAGAAAVLFDRESLRGDPAPRRSAGEGFTHAVAPGLVSSGRGVERAGETRGQDPVVAEAFGGNNCAGPIDVATACNSHGGPHGRLDFESETFVAEKAPTIDASFSRLLGCAGQDANHGHGHLIAHALRADGFDASEDGTGRGAPIVPICVHADAVGRTGEAKSLSADATGRLRLRDAGMGICSDGTAFGLTTGQPHAVAFNSREDCVSSDEVFGSLGSSSPQAQAVAFQSSQSGVRIDDVHATLDSNNGSRRHNGVVQNWAVRRLTPTECARLMGVPDDFLRITYRGKPAADGPIYKALGNSQGTNVQRWICRGIAEVDALQHSAAA